MVARSRAFLQTKVWTTGGKHGQMQRSAQLLRTDVIDLMQIHNLVDWRTQLATFRRMKAEGRIRYIGITYYTISALPELARILVGESGIEFVQLGYSPATREPENELLPTAAAHGIAFIVNQPFAEETVEIFIEADFEALSQESRRIALLNIPRHLFSEAAAAVARRAANLRPRRAERVRHG